MQLVINVSDYDLEYIRNMYDIPKDISVSMAEALLNGRKIPPHGRLIDADAFKETIDYYIREAGWSDAHNEALGWVKEFIDNEQAVIEAEGSEA